MFDTIFGLPVHALVIHAVIVLVPLCSVSVVVMLASAVWRDHLRVPVLLLLLASVGSALVAKQSGEALRQRLGIKGDLIDRHVELGNAAPFIVLAFGVLYLVWFWFSRPGAAGAATAPGRLQVLLAATTIVGLVALGWIVATGHAGSNTVWRDIVRSTNAG